MTTEAGNDIGPTPGDGDNQSNDDRGDVNTAAGGDVRMLRPGRIGLAWLMAVGVDLFFNAGVFAPLFVQSREPALLPDEVLFRRVPVAYAILVLAVTGLAWMLDAVAAQGGRAIRIGATAGLVLGLAGLGAIWTALDVTGLFVVAGIVVVVAEGAAVAAVLTSRRSSSSLSLRVIGAFVLLAGVGQVVANVVEG